MSGRVNFAQGLREAFRRGRASFSSRRERASIDQLALQPARLTVQYQNLPAAELLTHFRDRTSPVFFAELEATSHEMIEQAREILQHRRPLLGFGVKELGEPIEWNRDPLSGRQWPLDYHADIPLWHGDGSDIRVLWELNRLGHLVTLAQAHGVTNDESFAEEFFAQLESWVQQNPLGRGPNWACAMEVALRAMNLLAALAVFRKSPSLTEERLLLLLKLFAQHGHHIRRNLEFSFVGTSNHYLTDVVGLLWLGISLPELESAMNWREWARRELLSEMDKQVLADGAHYEAATGYHQFAVELFLYSFLLSRLNGVQLSETYQLKLQGMLEYLASIVRPDGTLPLIGDSDGGKVFSNTNPQTLFALGSAILPLSRVASSRAFEKVGTYVLRNEDLMLLFNAAGSNSQAPVSHRHNDALSIDVTVGKRAFIVDPGTFVYTADLHERHLFRSTAYHSSVQIDDQEQQTINEAEPFRNGGEARVRVLAWDSDSKQDRVVAEHAGYERLPEPVVHRREIVFDKIHHWWLINDELIGRGKHKLETRFHFDVGLEVTLDSSSTALAKDKQTGVILAVCNVGLNQSAVLEEQFVSREYGSKGPSVTACWTVNTDVPCKLQWALIPVLHEDDLDERLKLLQSLRISVLTTDH